MSASSRAPSPQRCNEWIQAMTTLKPISLALLLTTAAVAQEVGPAPFEKVWGATFPYCFEGVLRPSLGTPPACTPNPPLAKWGKVRTLWWSAEGAIATTARKDPRVTAGGSQLVFERDASTASPLATSSGCPDGANVPSNTACYPKCRTCFNVADGLDTASTCLGRRLKSPYRGTLNGKTLHEEIQLAREQAAIQRPGGPTPINVLAARWDLLMWTELQLEGFDPAWLAVPGRPEHAGPDPAGPWADFHNWLVTDTSDSCATRNSDCTGSHERGTVKGKGGIQNTCCVDGVGQNYAWENSCGGFCTWSYSNGGFGKPIYDPEHGWASGSDLHDMGMRYNDLISLRGGDPEKAIYYATRPHGQHWAPSGVVVRMDAPAYQDWRIRQIKLLLQESGAEMVHLNQKIFQYSSDSYYVRDLVPKYDLNSPCGNHDGVVQVAEVVCAGEGGFTGNQASGGYHFSDWARGWRQIADKIHAAGLKYQVTMNWTQWMPGRCTNFRNLARPCHFPSDPICQGEGAYCKMGSDDVVDTPPPNGVDENDTVRSVTYDADFVYIDDENRGSDSAHKWCAGSECSDCTGLTGVYLKECRWGCKGLTGAPLLECALRGAGVPYLRIGSPTTADACRP